MGHETVGSGPELRNAHSRAVAGTLGIGITACVVRTSCVSVARLLLSLSILHSADDEVLAMTYTELACLARLVEGVPAKAR